jgi:hypothetical protein
LHLEVSMSLLNVQFLSIKTFKCKHQKELRLRKTCIDHWIHWYKPQWFSISTPPPPLPKSKTVEGASRCTVQANLISTHRTMMTLLKFK